MAQVDQGDVLHLHLLGAVGGRASGDRVKDERASYTPVKKIPLHKSLNSLAVSGKIPEKYIDGEFEVPLELLAYPKNDLVAVRAEDDALYPTLVKGQTVVIDRNSKNPFFLSHSPNSRSGKLVAVVKGRRK